MDTILVVDDEAANLNIIGVLSAWKGTMCLRRLSGPRAIELSNCEHRPIQLLVTDLELGTVSGTDVATKILESVLRWPSSLSPVRR